MHQTVVARKISNRSSDLIAQGPMKGTSLSRLLGITKQALSNYKQGDRNMPVDTAVKINDILRNSS